VSQRKKALLQLVALVVILGLVTWHTVYWHQSGMDAAIFNYINEGKGYLTVLYYTGLTISTSILLALLIEKSLEIAGYQSRKETSGGGE